MHILSTMYVFLSLLFLSFLSIYRYLFLSIYLSAIYLQNRKSTLITFNCSRTLRVFAASNILYLSIEASPTVKELASFICNTFTYLLNPSPGHLSLKYMANSVLVLSILTCGLLSWTQSYRTCWLSSPQS